MIWLALPPALLLADCLYLLAWDVRNTDINWARPIARGAVK